MEQIIQLLGFTDIPNTIWNIFAYIGMILITVAVVSERWRGPLFVVGPLILLVYAWMYLHNPILAGLQLVVAVSGTFNLLGIKKNAPFVVGTLAVGIFAALILTGQISGIWPWFGALGLLGIALGLTARSAKRSFVLMAAGGFLIVIYSFFLHIWVWFVLNTIFFAANILELKKTLSVDRKVDV